MKERNIRSQGVNLVFGVVGIIILIWGAIDILRTNGFEMLLGVMVWAGVVYMTAKCWEDYCYLNETGGKNE